jgi:hypothetical protein
MKAILASLSEVIVCPTLEEVFLGLGGLLFFFTMIPLFDSVRQFLLTATQ